MPLISIIVPCFNNEKYVEKCLDSINQQSFKDFEVIIINDGSTDNSKEIIEHFIKTKPNYHLINQKNMGVSTARNNGLKLVKGEFVCFVDADDYIESNYLKELYKAIKETHSDLCMQQDPEERVLADGQKKKKKVLAQALLFLESPFPFLGHW